MFRRNAHILFMGVSFGLLLGWFSHSAYSHSWIGGTVSGLGVGLFSALLMAGVTYLLTRIVERFFRAPGCLAVFVCGAAVLAGYLAFRATLLIPGGEWQPIPNPPEKAIEIMGHSVYTDTTGTLYVRMQTGKLYAFAWANRYHREGDNTWHQVNLMPESFEKGDDCDRPISHPLFYPPTPGKVVSAYTIDTCEVDYAFHTRYVVLSDGTLWHWRQFYSAIGDFFLLVLLVGVSGILGLIALFLTISARRTPKNSG